DVTVLQFALTLEHLESAFYHGALEKFDANAFASAGFPTWVRERYEQIAGHEASHVAFLTKAIGDNATKPCTYSFPYTDPKSFAALSLSIEGVGTAAYTGAAHLLSNPDDLNAAGSILATEARQTSWIHAAVNKGEPWSGAYQTPLTPSGAYSLASPFIKSCPESNPPLPVKAFPGLTISPSMPKAGSTIKVAVDKFDTVGMFMAYYSGLSVLSSEIQNGETVIPEGLQGVVFAGVVSEKSTQDKTPTDETMKSGLVAIDFGLPADAKDTSPM
ncbi:hypothetical protein GLOTRDRAFT_46095, partial [Gloeophyllum trabeum ATCC 11539]